MKYLLVLMALAGAVIAEVAHFRPCDESPASVCTISEVRLTPCKNPNLCKMFTGTWSSISFDYTPKFSVDKLKAGLFWARDGEDVPFPVLYNADGCEFTKCPVEADKQQTLDYSLRLGKKLPTGNFVFKFKIWDEADTTKLCCFETNVRLTKK